MSEKISLDSSEFINKIESNGKSDYQLVRGF